MAINKIGIRQLVEFVLKSGDLNASINSQNTAAQGARIHRKIQNHQGPDYQKEYFVKKLVQIDHEKYSIEGRADGVIISNQLLIEEIKTSDPDYEDLTDNIKTLYWSQAKVYGAILTKELDFEEVTIQLTYYKRPTGEIKKFKKQFKRQELQEFFDKLIKEYEKWVKLRRDWRKKRNKTAKALNFPFKTYRHGQRDLAVAVYKTILTRQRLFVEAPTGTGKTMSTLFPTIKALGEKKIDRIFYLSAKQSTQHVANQALKLMHEQGLQLKSIVLTAKDKITFPEEVDLKPEDNPYMVGYYDRVKDGMLDILTNENMLTKDVIQTYAKKHMLDPFEFSLDTSLFCDVIICDYNYLFDPLVYLQRFFSIEDDNNFFLIDEVHNLVSRSRAMYSATLNQDLVLKTRDLFADNPDLTESKSIKRQLSRIINELDLIDESLDGKDQDVSYQPLDSLEKAMLKFNDATRDWLPKQNDDDIVASVLELFFAINKYLKISEFFDESYRVLIKKEDNQLQLQEQILDPSPYLNESLKKGRGAILFSATLSPVEYYKDTLGSKKALSMQLDSPFNRQKQNLLIANYIDTKYQVRQQNLPQIVASVAELTSGKKGKYLIFCPSYQFLNQISAAFSELFPEYKVLNQTTAMTIDDRQSFLNNFKEHQTKTLVGFAVLGGIFSEGIDLPNDQLIGVGIVGVGLPGLSFERNLLRDYFDNKNGRGFEYAYQLPGMNHVLQAAGRLIRTNQDCGNVVLLDKRFTSRRYQRLFPKHWQHYQIVRSTNELKNKINHFWNDH